MGRLWINRKQHLTIKRSARYHYFCKSIISDNKSDFSGNYSDLNGLPVIPTNTSDLNNDSGYITSNDLPALTTVPTNISELENDSNYLTEVTSEYVTEEELTTKDYSTTI